MTRANTNEAAEWEPLNASKAAKSQKRERTGSVNESAQEAQKVEKGKSIKQEVALQFADYIKDFILETKDLQTALTMARRTSICINDLQL